MRRGEAVCEAPPSAIARFPGAARCATHSACIGRICRTLRACRSPWRDSPSRCVSGCASPQTTNSHVAIGARSRRANTAHACSSTTQHLWAARCRTNARMAIRAHIHQRSDAIEALKHWPHRFHPHFHPSLPHLPLTHGHTPPSPPPHTHTLPRPHTHIFTTYVPPTTLSHHTACTYADSPLLLIRDMRRRL